MSFGRGLLAVALLLTACSACFRGAALPALEPASALQPPLRVAAPEHDGEGVPIVSRPALRVALRGPRVLTYDPGALGPSGPTVSLRVTNVSRSIVPIEGLRASFVAKRDGVEFPCNHHVRDSGGAREATSLDPGQAFTFERSIDCTMPLPGEYEVQVSTHFGDRNDLTASAGDPVGSFAVDVVANAADAPKPYVARPGLYALISGDRAARPHPERGGSAEYRVVLALINASARPVPVGPAHLDFLVYGAGSSLPCSERQSLVMPERLEPAAVHLLHVPIACAPREEGQYQIVGRLTLGDHRDGLEVGRLVVTVKREAPLVAPQSRYWWADRP